MIDKYLDHIQEGYLINERTISIDLDKFESGESNKLLVVGLSGGGKSTLSKYLSKKYNCYHNELDDCCKSALTPEEYQDFIMLNSRTANNKTIRIYKSKKRKGKHQDMSTVTDLIKRGLILNFKNLQKDVNTFKKLRKKHGGNIQTFDVPMLKGV
jgi:GTPase SAR1 family protein